MSTSCGNCSSGAPDVCGPPTSSHELEVHLLGLLELEGLLPPLHDVLRLDAHDASTPALLGLRIVVELCLEAFGKLVQLVLVFVPDRGQGDARCFLLVHELAQTALALDDAVWYVLLAAKRRHPDDQ